MIAGFVRPSVPEDVEGLHRRLRQADVDEAEAVGLTPLEALGKGLHGSLQPLTVVVEKNGRTIPIAMLGAVRETPNLGRIWMLGSDEVEEAWVPFARQSRAWFRHVAAPFSEVSNIVDLRNHVHVRWLRWCGCRFVGVHKIGRNELPFVEFYWRRNDP